MITQFKLFEFDVDKQYFFKFKEIEDYFNGSVVDIENFFVHLQGSAIVIIHADKGRIQRGLMIFKHIVLLNPKTNSSPYLIDTDTLKNITASPEDTVKVYDEVPDECRKVLKEIEKKRTENRFDL